MKCNNFKIDWDRCVLWLALFLFIASFFQLMQLSCFPKMMLVYPDELRYLHLSDAIANQGHILIRDSFTNFSKILYPIVLLPISWLSGTEYYIPAIGFVNSMLMALLVPICLWMGRICRLNGICMVFLLTMAFMMPDRVYAMTFMSENLYLPFGVFVLVIAWKWMDIAIDDPWYMMYAGMFGVLVYLLYLNKEVGIVFLPAYAMVILYRYATNAQFRNVKTLLRMCFPFLVFGIIYAVMKLTLFSGMMNVYSIQLIPRTGGLFDWIPYLLHSYLINLTWVLLAFFFFPVIFPLVYWNNLHETMRIRYLFLLSVLMITIAVVTYTISLYEDFPSLTPRQHLRYVSFLFLPFLAIFLHTIVEHWRVNKGRFLLLVLATISFLTSLILVEMPFSSGSLVDQVMLKYVVEIDPLIGRCIIFLLVILMLGLFLKKYRYAIEVFACIAVVICGWNMILAKVNFYDAYTISDAAIQPYRTLSQEFKHRDTVVYIDFRTMGAWMPVGNTCTMLDTYCINQVKFLSGAQLQIISDIYTEQGAVDLSYLCDARNWPLDMVDRIHKKYYPDVIVSSEMAVATWNEFCPILQNINYILVDRGYESRLELSKLRLIDGYGELLLYENTEPDSIPYKPLQW